MEEFTQIIITLLIKIIMGCESSIETTLIYDEKR